TEENRLELGMAIGEMQQCHLPCRIELQKVILGQLLLRQRPRRIGAQASRAENEPGIQGILQKISPGMHLRLHSGENSVKRGRSGLRQTSNSRCISVVNAELLMPVRYAGRL